MRACGGRVPAGRLSRAVFLCVGIRGVSSLVRGGRGSGRGSRRPRSFDMGEVLEAEAAGRERRGRATPGGPVRGYFRGGAGDGGAGDAGQRPRHRVRQVVAQTGQGGYQPVDGHRPVAGTGTRGPLPAPPDWP
jgi:hypothetical protein